MSKQLSIIIINYNTLALTKQCIASIFKYCDESLFELIVVDNASTKEDPTVLLQDFPSIKLIINIQKFTHVLISRQLKTIKFYLLKNHLRINGDLSEDL
jgi:glycosyltransferase involved in cell wall biosynthesis